MSAGLPMTASWMVNASFHSIESLLKCEASLKGRSGTERQSYPKRTKERPGHNSTGGNKISLNSISVWSYPGRKVFLFGPGGVPPDPWDRFPISWSKAHCEFNIPHSYMTPHTCTTPILAIVLKSAKLMGIGSLVMTERHFTIVRSLWSEIHIESSTFSLVARHSAIASIPTSARLPTIASVLMGVRLVASAGLPTIRCLLRRAQVLTYAGLAKTAS